MLTNDESIPKDAEYYLNGINGISVKEAANEMIGNNVRHLLIQDSASHDILV